MIDWNKSIRFVPGRLNGCTATLIGKLNGSKYPNIVKVTPPLGVPENVMFLTDGGHNYNDDYPAVENIPEEPKSRFFNVYLNRPTCAHGSLENAKAGAFRKKTGITVEIKGDVMTVHDQWLGKDRDY